MILKLSFVASSEPSAPTQIMPADMVRDATAWRLAQDSYQLILRPWHECVSTQNPRYVEFIKGLMGAPRSL
jgi:hypothetical protein